LLLEQVKGQALVGLSLLTDGFTGGDRTGPESRSNIRDAATLGKWKLSAPKSMKSCGKKASLPSLDCRKPRGPRNETKHPLGGDGHFVALEEASAKGKAKNCYGVREKRRWFACDVWASST
jgi:hypothetical protein